MSGLTSSTTTAKVGLLRIGELMAGQFNRNGNNATYWTLTPFTSSNLNYITAKCSAGSNNPSTPEAIKPTFNLKSNVVITAGDGTLQNQIGRASCRERV